MDESKNIKPHTLNEPAEPSPFRLVFTLGVAGLLSGIILVSMYNYTDPLIKANKKAAIQRAIFKVLPGCETYKTLLSDKGGLVILEEGVEKLKNNESQEENLVYAGFDENSELIGFAVPGNEPGFQDIIATMFGYDASKNVIIGFEVLESKETPGLGDKIFKDEAFQLNFKGLEVEPEIVMVKKGEKQKNNEVEAITGATISSKAVVRSLNKSVDLWEELIINYVEESKKLN